MRKHKGMEAPLFEAAKARFQAIMEYTIPQSGLIGEDEKDGNGEDAAPAHDMQGDGGQMPPADNPMPPVDAQGDMPAQPQADMPMPQMDAAPVQTPQGLDPQSDMSQGDFEGGEQPTEDDDVVDITDLTDAQNNTEREIGEIGEKFNAVLKNISKFEDLLKANDEKIEDLKAEFERRNPTQVEKMSMNTAQGGPFSVSPEEYWDEKEKTSNYSRESDENGKNSAQYVITANDVNGDTDWNTIADSLDDDFYLHQNLSKILAV